MGLYKQSDMTKVQNAAGEVLPDEVPKSWIGTDLLAEGTKAAGRKAKAEGDSSSTPDPNALPAKSASKADWVAYATADERGEAKVDPEKADALTRDELAALFHKD